MNSIAPIRLRRLEIQGFKSFATRTSFEFGPGITAIVGPNGSGKSNLTDALRWVLGEQNPRALRLRRLEDAIFAGGGKRAQAGFAEVGITLDNADGWLPIEFGEVVVTRRLHRSGESEYLINRKRVRLRDILDLFLKARLGQNSYAILGQGLVDMVLSLRPEERRFLIEEAADVRRHRLKIDEAVDQLAATRDNRDRVELLLAEISPRLAQLERQTHRAREHAQLAGQLAEAMQQRYAVRAQSAWSALSSARRELATQDERARQAQIRIEASESQLAQAEVQAGEAAGAVELAETEWRRAREAVGDAERALRDTRARIPVLLQRHHETEGDLASLREEAAALETETPSPESIVAAQREGETAVAECEHALATLGVQLQQAKVTLAEKRRDDELARDSRREAERQLARAGTELRRRQQEQALLFDRRKKALGQMAGWSRDYEHTMADARDLGRRLAAAKMAASDAMRRSQAASALLQQAESALAALNGHLEGQQRRLEVLEEERDARTPAEDVIVALLDALRGGGPGRPRVLGILGGLLHVQVGLEVAIEAALGESLNGLIVRTEGEALTAIGLLQRIEAGRLTFFVLEGQRAAHPINLGSEGGVLGVASRFVQCDDAYLDLFEALLGRTIVVENLQAAQQVVRRGLGSAVTLDGTVLRPGGSLSGGAGKSDGHIFRAGRELEELRAIVAQSSSELSAHLERVAGLRERAAEAARRLTASEENLADLLRRSESLEAALVARRRRFEPIRGELERVRMALQDGDTRLTALESELSVARSRIEHEADSGVDRRSSELTAAQEQFEAIAEEHRAAEARLAELRGQRAALARERAAFEALNESRRAARARTSRLIAARETALQSLERERAQSEEEAVQRSARLLELKNEVKALLDRLEPRRQRVAELAQRRQVLIAAIQSERTTASVAERARLDAELAVARAKAEIEQLEEEATADGVSIEPGSVEPGSIDEAQMRPSRDDLERTIRALRGRIRSLGAINEEAETDFLESKERHDFLTMQISDLREAETRLEDALDQLRLIVRDQFRGTFQAVNTGFQAFFRTFFGGGQARLVLSEPEDYGESGVDIIAQPPGKRLQNLAMLSGGERSMTAVALLFALLESNTAPFCVLDEVDAALDEPNVGRFSGALAKLATRGQFLVVTHNRGTVQAADNIYGISMTGDGISNVLSMRMADAAPLLA